MDFLSAPRGDLIRLIYDLIDEKNALKAQIAELRERLGEKEPKGGKILPDFLKPNVKRKKKKGPRKKRALAFTRKRGIPTKEIFHSYEVCPDCGGFLGKPSVAFGRQIIDIPIAPAEVTQAHNFQKMVYPLPKECFSQA